MLQNAMTQAPVAPLELAQVHDLETRRQEKHAELLARARDEMVGGDEEAALEICLEAIKYGRSYSALALAGTLLAILGELEESLELTKEAIEVDPSRADAYYDMASTLLDMGQPAQALVWIEKGAQLLGDRSDDLVDFMWSARIEALTCLGRIEEAESALEQARRLTEDELNLVASAGELLEERRHRPELRLV